MQELTVKFFPYEAAVHYNPDVMEILYWMQRNCPERSAFSYIFAGSAYSFVIFDDKDIPLIDKYYRPTNMKLHFKDEEDMILAKMMFDTKIFISALNDP